MSALGWTEIPAHRVYVATDEELHEAFDVVDEQGQPSAFNGEFVALCRRRRDGKVFRVSPWQSQESFRQRTITLVEL